MLTSLKHRTKGREVGFEGGDLHKLVMTEIFKLTRAYSLGKLQNWHNNLKKKNSAKRTMFKF
jgi:hypothetical protein